MPFRTIAVLFVVMLSFIVTFHIGDHAAQAAVNPDNQIVFSGEITGYPDLDDMLGVCGVNIEVLHVTEDQTGLLDVGDKVSVVWPITPNNSCGYAIGDFVEVSGEYYENEIPSSWRGPGPHWVVLTNVYHYIKKSFNDVNIRGYVVDPPQFNGFVGVEGINVLVIEIIQAPMGNVDEGETVTVTWKTGSVYDDTFDVGEYVEVKGESRYQKMPYTWANTGSRWVSLTGIGHYVATVDAEDAPEARAGENGLE